MHRVKGESATEPPRLGLVEPVEEFRHKTPRPPVGAPARLRRRRRVALALAIATGAGTGIYKAIDNGQETLQGPSAATGEEIRAETVNPSAPSSPPLHWSGVIDALDDKQGIDLRVVP